MPDDTEAVARIYIGSWNAGHYKVDDREWEGQHDEIDVAANADVFGSPIGAQYLCVSLEGVDVVVYEGKDEQGHRYLIEGGWKGKLWLDNGCLTKRLNTNFWWWIISGIYEPDEITAPTDYVDELDSFK